MNQNKSDFTFKIVMTGDSGVGKSQLIQRFVSNTFEDNHSPTLGVEISTQFLDIDNKKIALSIWDTMGQEQYQSLASLYYKGAGGAILVFDIFKRESFLSIAKWKENLSSNCSETVATLLIGNKLDLKEQRQVTHDEAIQYAEELNFAYIETSAKDSTNVNRAFELLAKEIYKINVKELKESVFLSPSFANSKIKGESLVEKKEEKKEISLKSPKKPNPQKESCC